MRVGASGNVIITLLRQSKTGSDAPSEKFFLDAVRFNKKRWHLPAFLFFKIFFILISFWRRPSSLPVPLVLL